MEMVLTRRTKIQNGLPQKVLVVVGYTGGLHMEIMQDTWDLGGGL